MDTQRKVTRREFLKWSGLIAGGAALAAVTPGVAAQAIEDPPTYFLPNLVKDYNPRMTPQGKALPSPRSSRQAPFRP